MNRNARDLGSAVEQPGRRREWSYGLQELIAVSAFLVSVASIVIAYQENRASKQLVQASSLPYLSLASTFDRDAAGNVTGVRRTLENDGVGPADIRFAQMRFLNRSYTDQLQLLRDCCGSVEPQTTASLTDRMIRAGTSVDFLVVKSPSKTDRAVDRYARLILGGQIATTICYCSVFSECWALQASGSGRPKPVKECAAGNSDGSGL